MMMFLAFFALTDPDSSMANPHCITEKDGKYNAKETVQAKERHQLRLKLFPHSTLTKYEISRMQRPSCIYLVIVCLKWKDR